MLNDVPIPYATIDSLDESAFKLFKKLAVKSGRMNESVMTDSAKTIMQNLELLDNGHLTRAALLPFHEDPEQFVPGAYVKIDFFRNSADLSYQVHLNDTFDLQIRENYIREEKNKR